MSRLLATFGVLTVASTLVAAVPHPIVRLLPGPVDTTPTLDVSGRSDGTAGSGAIGATDPGELIDFSLVLRLPGRADLEQYLDALHDPSAAEYRHFLAPEEFGARFGVADDALARVREWIASVGLTESEAFPQRTSIVLRGTIGAVSSLFHVRFSDFVDAQSGRVFHAPDRDPVVPAEIADSVEGVAGLTNRPPASARPLPGTTFAVPEGGLGPENLAAAYHITPLYDRGIHGEGQTVAVVSFDTYLDSDIAAFDEEYGIEGPPVERVDVQGGVPDSPGQAAGEVTLDLTVVRAVAPQAQILNYEAPYEVSQASIINAIVADRRADIVTDSYGVCYAPEYVSEDDRRDGLQALESAVSAGVSVLVASGDWGAYDCWTFDPSDHRLSVDWPSSTPFTVAVGGTYLSVREDGTYLSEAGWEDYLEVGGTGGGLNPLDARPDWQHGPGVDNEFSDGMRQSPDVAATADTDTGYTVYFTDPFSGESGFSQFGGTSASSPFWAGSLALIRQLAEREGVGPLGFVNPMLYDIAESEPASTVFHDVTRGGNLFHNATPGWDYATGLGSPDVALLGRAVVEYLTARR
ncbi:MAG: S53 family peptidase [Chloroflexota bacterium]|nr:S53 family peptidase [Chloroflexota bacterium]